MIRQSPDQGDRGEGHRGAYGRVQRPHRGRACNDGHTKRRPAARQGGQNGSFWGKVIAFCRKVITFGAPLSPL